MDDATDTTRSTTTPPGDGAGAARRRATTGEAFRAQLALLSRRWMGLVGVAAALAGLLVLADMGGIPSADSTPTGVPFSVALGRAWSFFDIVALFWAPGLAWKDEGPSDRAYHWTLPVDRPVHQMLRLAAGWVLLVGVLAAAAAAGWLAGAVLQGGMPAGDPAVLGGVLPSATVLYLVGSLFALVTDRPLLWFVVAYLAAVAASSLGVFEAWTWLAELAREVFFSGRLSLTSAASVPSAVADPAGGTPWRAAALWLAVTASLTAAAARLHLERSGEG